MPKTKRATRSNPTDRIKMNRHRLSEQETNRSQTVDLMFHDTEKLNRSEYLFVCLIWFLDNNTLLCINIKFEFGKKS